MVQFGSFLFHLQERACLQARACEGYNKCKVLQEGTKKVPNSTIRGNNLKRIFISLSLSLSLSLFLFHYFFSPCQGNGVIKNCQVALERGRKSIIMSQIIFFALKKYVSNFFYKTDHCDPNQNSFWTLKFFKLNFNRMFKFWKKHRNSSFT